ncbi:MAG: hypothetical protein IK008_02600 [Bacteroidales bacterium]|nr:hypothetical protein [Bacteroidales bacterium]
MKRHLYLAAVPIVAAAILSASCQKPVFTPETPVVPAEEDDPGVYEPGFYVTVNGAGLFTGEDWANAMSVNDLKDLLLADENGVFSAEKAARINGKIIHLEQGVYQLGTADMPTPVISGETAGFSVTIKGGYKSGVYTQYPEKYHSTLSGGSDYHIFQMKGNVKLKLDSVGLTGGSGRGGGQAAVIVSGGELTLYLCDVFNNYNTYTAGGLHISGNGILRANNCRFYNNVAGNAGAINLGNASAYCYLMDCEFFNNSANEQGGAIKVTTGTLLATDCTFRANRAEVRGGVAWVAGCKSAKSVVFERCVFQDNASYSGGGVLWQDGGSTVTFKDCDFESNSATHGSAGAIYANEGASTASWDTNTTYVENCRFKGNYSQDYNGGSLHVRGNAYGNSALHCTDCTFEGEHTVAAKGGLIALGGSGAPLATFNGCHFKACYSTVTNSIFYNYATEGKLYFNACRFENNYINKTYSVEGTPDSANAFVGLNNCAVSGGTLTMEGGNSQQACWYNLMAGKVLFSNSSLIGVPTAAGQVLPAFGLVRLNSNDANVRFVNNIIVSTHAEGCGIYGGDTQTSLTVTGSYNKMSPVRTQKEGSFTYTSGAGDDLTAYATSFPGLEWGENGWKWDGHYTGSAVLGATATINTAIHTFDAGFYGWLESIGALGKDIRGKERGTTSWPGSYQD